MRTFTLLKMNWLGEELKFVSVKCMAQYVARVGTMKMLRLSAHNLGFHDMVCINHILKEVEGC